MELDNYSKRCAIKTVLLSQLLLEQIDELKDTSIYNHGIKNLITKLEGLLNPFCRKYYDSIYDKDVQKGIDVLDAIVDSLVHNIVIDVEDLEPYNLYVLKDKNGRKTTIKSNLTPSDFEKKYNIKLTNLISKEYKI